MRKKIVAGNWKMNNGLSETIELINDLKQNLSDSDVKVMIAPSYPFLKTACFLKNQQLDHYWQFQVI